MSKIKSLNTALTQKDFELIKKLLDLGLSAKEISKLSRRSEGTIHGFKVASTLEEYKQTVRAKSDRAKAKRLREQFPPVIAEPFLDGPTRQDSTVDQDPSELRIFDEKAMSLERIAIALERLADAWEKQPDKKKSFFN